MKHINITNWQGNITDWTKFNYVYGGLDETIADRVNLSIPGTNLRNYFRKSNNLVNLPNIPSTTRNGITYKVENGVVTFNGTATTSFTLVFDFVTNVPKGNCYSNFFTDSDALEFDLYFNNTSINVSDVSKQQLRFNTNVFNMLLYIGVGRTYNNYVFKPMLVSGSTVPTTYEPYGSMVMVENVGKTYVTSSWVYEATTSRVRTIINDMKVQTTRTLPIQMNGYRCVSDGSSYDPDWDKVIYNANTDQLAYAYITNKSYTSLEQWVENEGNNPIIYPLAEPKTTIIHTLTLNGGSDEDWSDRLGYTYADRFVLSSKPITRNASGYVNWPGFEYTTSLPDTYPYVSNNNGTQIVVNFSAKGTTTLEQFKEHLKKHNLIITYWQDSSSTTTLSLANPMQLEDTNVDEDVEYLEDTEFNEEILSEE